MLDFILGRAGSGKTHFVREKICQLAKDPQFTSRLILLIPEQYSFETERAMLRLLGPKDVQQVEILSFRRLAEVMFQRYGNRSGKRLDDGGRGILMSLALEQVEDQLQVYHGYTQTAELVSMMLSVSTELKLCAISPEQFGQVGKQVEDVTLRAKIQDITLILSVYDALVEQSFLDPLDDLVRVKDVILAHQAFQETVIFLDSFKGFTNQELDLLELMLIQSEEVHVSLCMDALDDPEHGMGLFAQVHKTANQIKRLARENHIAVGSPVYLEPGKRFTGKAMAHLEQQLFCTKKSPFSGSAAEVTLFAASSPYEEATFIASTIRRLVMEQGYRYQDFAVITRSLEASRNDLDMALTQYQIPFFMDNPKKIDADPLMRLVLSAFQIVRSAFASDDVFIYLKTGLVCGLSSYEISLMENYSYLWNLSGNEWRAPWTRHPRGFEEEFTEEDRAALEQLNALRQKVIAPLEKFSYGVTDQTGEEISRAIYELLLEIQADACLLALCERLKQCGQMAAAEEQLRLWEILMAMLDQIAAVLRNKILPPQRFAEFLRLVMIAGDLSTIPQGLDEIRVGEAGRMRPDEPKVVFVFGAIEGEFPAAPCGGGAFCDRERHAMIELGLPLASTLEDVALEERFLAYTALTAPSQRLYVSWHTSNVNGATKIPSVLVREIRMILPQVSEQSSRCLPKEFFANSWEAAFELLAREYRNNSPLTSALKALFVQRPEFAPPLSALDRACQKALVTFVDPEKSNALFGVRFHASATQIEQYHLCRFQYFCRYGLGAQERRPAVLDALEYGSLMHHLLERMFGEYGHDRLSRMERDVMQRNIQTCMEQYVDQKMGGIQEQTPWFRSLLGRMADSAQVVIARIAEELNQSKFLPKGYEMSLRRGGDFPPFKVPLPDGGQVVVDGVIDRVDTFEENGKTYVRIVDYKTGKKEFRLSDVLYGLNLQMLIYLAAIVEQGELAPAGILYMPAVRPSVSALDGESREKVEKKASDELRMNGLLIDQISLLEAMESGGQGRYIPASQKKDGSYSSASSVISGGQMQGVLCYVKDLIVKMAANLKAGNIPPNPLKGDYDACAYCPYFPVCGHEEADGGRMEIRYPKSKEKETVLRKMEAEQKEEVQ
ncbi:MAG: helicase [Clostridiales bacterium]|jgi:ATP-dependent helicase/nuclease subunit B|nr:helicase [Clostridiales bacterium]